MPVFDECCVLIPVSTLEDFPSDLSDYDARSLLAAWTVLWNPHLLAQTEQIPTWYRADSPPEPVGKRLFTVPNPSLTVLPDGYRIRAEQSEDACWVTGDSREAMLAKLDLPSCPALTDGSRTVTEQDFYAAAYASLQVQVMTRRLRYTSNLDEIHLQNRLISAAKSFIEGKTDDCISALHDVFDCLAEERDHYFSSDPHLIDLVLTSESTIEGLLQIASEIAADTTSVDHEPADASDQSDVLPAPINILVDGKLCQTLARTSDSRTEKLKELLKAGTIGWAGGGPASDVCLDAMTLRQAESMFVDSYDTIKQALGIAPPVYGRFAGTTPADLTATLARIGYCGMIPIDFAGGRGFGDEAKVIMQSAAGDLEALTAKPIDADSDAAFLNLGAKLGEAIDSGEIATALLAHWPGKTCDSFADLQRVASWSLSLGKFWKLDAYFKEGEHPYHNGNLTAASPDAADWLKTLADSGTGQAIEEAAQKFRQQLTSEKNSLLAGMTQLTSGKVEMDEGNPTNPGEALASAMGFSSENGQQDKNVLVLNPHSNGLRTTISTSGKPASTAKHIFASTQENDKSETTVDVPGCGFVLLRSGDNANQNTGGFAARLRKTLMGNKKSIAEDQSLTNEFMEVAISATTGGVAGVYSGGARGNRFSMRLVRCSPIASDSKKSIPGDETQMRCTSQRIISSNAASGTIETRGELFDTGSEAVLANFVLRYSLSRGSRSLQVSGDIEILREVNGDPWENYYALRVAVADESCICRALLRDKVHRPGSRRVVSPLGVLLDESERQTLICSHGSAFHRRVGNRFVDTLIAIPKDTNANIHVNYGMDFPNPVNAARELLCGPEQITVADSENAPETGWLMHLSPRDLLVSELKMARCNDGRLMALVKLIQTRAQQCKAKVRFLRDVECAYIVTGAEDSRLQEIIATQRQAQTQEESSKDADKVNERQADESAEASGLHALDCQGDLVSLTMQGHASIQLAVVFTADD